MSAFIVPIILGALAVAVTLGSFLWQAAHLHGAWTE